MVLSARLFRTAAFLFALRVEVSPDAAAQPATASATESGTERRPAEPPAAPFEELQAPENAPESDAGAEAEPPETPPTEGAPDAAASEPVPPVLKHSAAPAFPEEAVRAGLTAASVTLKVRVGVDGHVEVLEVIESAGYGFDEAAEEVASHYSFVPARVGDRPVAALVLLRVDFRAPEPVPPSPPVARERVVTPAPPEVKASPRTTPAAELPLEVTIQGETEADRLRRSAEAVTVLETTEAKRHAQDMGEVLARTQGVGVQRSSGLGSDTRVYLSGLTDDQIRFFLDGVPLEFSGYQFGIANVPVNLVYRIEVYRGVVPVRFGGDALGGAINLVSNERLKAGAHGAASLQTGSFGTYRATVNGDYLDPQRGWFTRVAGFLDLADNNYPMETLVPDASGQDKETRVYRFHDGYRALGANIEGGVVDQPWAKRFSLVGFVSNYYKDVQHNLFMSFSPYGDVSYGQFASGGTLHYEQVLAKRVLANVVAGYAYRHTSYIDVGECRYNWFGQCVEARQQPGERINRAQDQDYWEHSVYGRANVEWRPHPEHAVQLSLSPTYTERTGKEHRVANPAARDPLSAERRVGGLVSGLEYELDLLDGDLENRLFVKDYLQLLRSEDPMPKGVEFRREDRSTRRVGWGDGLRYSFLEWLYAKASYEWATRLPRPDEIFGNAFPVQPNVDLAPETSHNVNLCVTVDSLQTSAGEWRAEVNGFLREVHDLIRLLGDEQRSSYQNVRDARSIGIETAVGWMSPGKYVALDGNGTYIDFRNTSKEGTDAKYAGDRIAFRPYFFATGSARLRAGQLATPRDEITLTWTSRYVHPFFLGWESLGTGKSVVPEQLLHSLALTYAVQGDPLDLSFSSELQNVTDARAFDYFGVPKPGRAVYFKMTTSL